MTFLGHVMSEQGIASDPEKIVALTTWLEIYTVTDLRSFLGYTGCHNGYGVSCP